MSSILQIVIPCKPLTTNLIYRRSKFGIYLTKEAKVFKQMVKNEVKSKCLNFDPDKNYVSLEIYFYLSRFYTKKGTISLTCGDTDNFKKILIDAIFEQLEINDAYICDSKDQKRYGESDNTVVIVRIERRESL